MQGQNELKTAPRAEKNQVLYGYFYLKTLLMQVRSAQWYILCRVRGCEIGKGNFT